MNNHRSHCPSIRRWITVALVCLLGLQLGAVPAFAQDESSLSPQQKKKLQKELQQTYKEGAKAGNEKNFEVAIARFEEAIQLAQKLGVSDIVNRIEGNIVNSLKGAASTALNGENYEEALSHYDKLRNYTDDDPSVHYNRGLALLNLEDSTDAGLQSLQTAIEIGNQTGNTRVAGLATERIRDEFVATASEALQGDNPSQSQIDTALDALDQMREYVDPSATSMFYRATALFAATQYQQAMQTAREGLDMHQGSRSDAAKFYYIIGESQMDTGNTAAACETFKNAAYGDYQARANHYLQNECDDL
jgi:tetratricopeptide (TPR) repeat protein